MNKSTKKIFESIRISDWNHFDDLVTNLPYRQWVFRGHSDISWELTTSLYRVFENLKKIKSENKIFKIDIHEQLLIERFRSNAHLFLKALPKENDSIE